MGETASVEELQRAFPREAIRQRQGGGGKMLSYVETHTVIHRLNATCPEWSFRVISMDWRPVQQGGKPADLIIVVGELSIPGLGSRQGVGVQVVSPNGGEDLAKGAASDALKKAATLFGVGLELYGPDYEGDGTPNAAPQRNGVTTQHQDNGGSNRPQTAKQAGGRYATKPQDEQAELDPGNFNDVCEECGAVLTKGQLQVSLAKHKRPLCPAHQPASTDAIRR